MKQSEKKVRRTSVAMTHADMRLLRKGAKAASVTVGRLMRDAAIEAARKNLEITAAFVPNNAAR